MLKANQKKLGSGYQSQRGKIKLRFAVEKKSEMERKRNWMWESFADKGR